MSILFLFVGVFVVGLALMVVELWNAPNGFQDETGFHVIESRNRPAAETEVRSEPALKATPVR
jgi:hypothetical protein